MSSVQFSVIYAGETHASRLRAILPGRVVVVTNRAQLIKETGKRGAVAFIDFDLLYQFDSGIVHVPIVAILNDSANNPLSATIRALDTLPWLSHVVLESMLSTNLAASHLSLVLERIEMGSEHSMVGDAVGRVALLASASRREARFDRMREFFTHKGLTPRTIAAICDAAEELVMNALYDAPAEAGYFMSPVPRTEDVSLPADRACEISYGIEDDNVYLRVRDSFGALTRARLFEVLNRCNVRSVPLDESRGGAGLGLWRVFSTASTVAITVVPGTVTDIVVGFATRHGRMIAKHVLATHMFFTPNFATLGPPDALDPLTGTTDLDVLDQSITLVYSS